MTDPRKLLAAVAVLLAALALAACGGGGSSSAESTSEGGAGSTVSESEAGESGGGESGGEDASALGTPEKATGKPIVFGMLNIENGPVTFPEVREAAEAAAKYVNEYKGGIQGRPIKIEECATDGQPATSTRCANQIVEKNPLLILGGADTGAAGSIPVYEREGLPYLGGIAFTPVEGNAKDAATFVSVSYADNLAAVSYGHNHLGAESGAVIGLSDTQGKFVSAYLKEEMENLGMQATTVSVSPTAADFSSPAAEAVSSSPEMVYVQVPSTCSAVLQALESVGNSAPVIGIDPCTSPQAIEAAEGAAEGLYFAQPFENPGPGSEQAEITAVVMEQFAPKTAIDSPALVGFNGVMNIAETLDKAPAADLEDPSKILALFTAGKENPNWLAHPYTCDRTEVPGQAAVCNGYEKIKQIKEGKVVEVTPGWENGTKYYQPPAE